MQVNWATLDPKFAKVWIQCHVNVCRNKGKPCLLEEVRSDPGLLIAAHSSVSKYVIGFAAMYVNLYLLDQVRAHDARCLSS